MSSTYMTRMFGLAGAASAALNAAGRNSSMATRAGGVVFMGWICCESLNDGWMLSCLKESLIPFLLRLGRRRIGVLVGADSPVGVGQGGIPGVEPGAYSR